MFLVPLSVSPHSNTIQTSKLTLYETRARFFMVGSGADEESFRIIKIDRSLDSSGALAVTDDKIVYSRQEMMDLLKMIESGNVSTGGLRRVASCFGIVGFIKFLEGYYMILITKRSAVALIGGHYVYHIDDTLLLGITGQSEQFEQRSNDGMAQIQLIILTEARYIQSFCQVDLTKNFYFSYTYDITNTLQRNMTTASLRPNKIFIWNHFLLKNGFPSFGDTPPTSSDENPWCLPIIYGFVDQAKIPVFGHDIYLTLIARRSRYFAGARFLKRGVNNEGFVANEVETEQIVHDANTTLFDAAVARALRGGVGCNGANLGITSFVQHRGSIPLYWSQDISQLTPKPPIELNCVDPYHTATSLHFSNMFERYGTPLIVLNLIKFKEKTPREGILLPEFRDSIAYLNTHLPDHMKMRYVEWDMARANKSDDPQEVVEMLEAIAEEVFCETNHSTNKEPLRILGRLQTGITRTNCIDCLDRTNAAQFMLGKSALAHQLHSLGILPSASPQNVPFDSDACNLLNSMYQDHGDTIALQYGGSHLVNTMETYRKIGHWTSHSRDMIESIRRYYSNSFTDAEKQDAINLFLGNFIPPPPGNGTGPMIWDLPSDYYLHHDPDPLPKAKKRSYKKWWIDPEAALPDHQNNTSVSANGTELEPYTTGNTIPTMIQDLFPVKADPEETFSAYYHPGTLTSFDRLYPSNMNRGGGGGSGGGNGIGPGYEFEGTILDLSPFAVRNNIATPFENTANELDKDADVHGYPEGGLLIYGIREDGVLLWLKGGAVSEPTTTNDDSSQTPKDEKEKSKERKQDHQQPLPWWTTSALSMRLLDPHVSAGEMKEYKR
ncbi:SacI homology domain-containing protein [Obelidium mucronatum]|nr:SacI homology domain-containing protein [Obelidium mucronatum]